MKKTLFAAAGLVLALTACQKEDITSGNGIPATQSITVSIPQTGMMSRAAISDYGDGSKINRCVMQVYHDGVPYGDRQVEPLTVDGTATFDLQLVASQTYDFVFWADCSANQDDKHYNTDDLQNITVKDGYAGNNDEFDAFFASEQHTIDGAFAKQVILKRPFGQLSVTTKDISAILDEALKPTDVQIAFTSVPTSFNALTKEAGDYAEVTYTAPVVNDAGELSVDYIWAAPEKSDLADFSMTFLNNGNQITTNDNFKNIPICCNYRTKVTGNLLTKQGTINVTINPEFEKPDITVVASTDELIGALNDPNVTNISITSDIDLSTQNAEELTFSTYKAIEIKEDKTVQLGNSNFLTAKMASR